MKALTQGHTASEAGSCNSVPQTSKVCAPSSTPPSLISMTFNVGDCLYPAWARLCFSNKDAWNCSHLKRQSFTAHSHIMPSRMEALHGADLTRARSGHARGRCQDLKQRKECSSSDPGSQSCHPTMATITSV